MSVCFCKKKRESRRFISPQQEETRVDRLLLQINRESRRFISPQRKEIKVDRLLLQKKRESRRFLVFHLPIEFLGLWESLYNPDFKGVDFDAFKNGKL